MTATETAYEVRLNVLGIGLAGCHGYCPDGCRITMYDRRLSAYYGELVQGGFVIDKSKPLEKRPGLAVAAPLCCGSLPVGTHKRFRDMVPNPGESIVCQVIACDPGNPAAGLARLMATDTEFGGFDDVSPDVYAAWWHKNGARVGARVGDEIVWTDGTREAIRPAASRWQC